MFSSSNIGGAERSLTRMTQTHQGRISYDLTTIGFEGDWYRWASSCGAQPIAFGSKNTNILASIVTILKVIAHIRKQNYEAIYFCGVRLSLALRLVKPLLRGAKLVHGIRSDFSSNTKLDQVTILLERYGSWLIDLYISNSQAAANSLTKRCAVSNSKVKVIYNGVPMVNIDSGKTLVRSSNVLTVANVAPRKGYLEYLEVVKLIRSTNTEVKFLAIGADYMRGLLQQQVREQDLSDNFSYIGYCENANTYMLSAKVFVLPALWGEGCPTVLMEAMMCGLPTVAYDIDGVGEIIDNGVNGLLIEKANSAAMADAISRLLNDSDLARQMGANAREKAQRLWSLDKCSLEHENTLTKLALGKLSAEEV